MCTPTIIDVNSVNLIVVQENPDPILNWIENGYGVLCYTGAGKLGQEIQRTSRFKQKLEAYKSSGRAKNISGHKMEVSKKVLEPEKLVSNDEDLLALILASNAEVVATEDLDLRRDIKSYIKAIKKKKVSIYPRDQKRKVRQKFLGNYIRVYPRRLGRFERQFLPYILSVRKLFQIFRNLLQPLTIPAVYCGYTNTNKCCNETT